MLMTGPRAIHVPIIDIFRLKPDAALYMACFDLLVEYSREAEQSRRRPINEDKTFALIDQYARHPAARGFVAMYDDKPAGLICASAADFVFDEPDVSIDIHFVSAAYRGTTASRLLRDVMLDELDKLPIGDVYTAAESGMGEENSQLFENLYKKRGFVYAGGRNLIRYKGK